jgi:aspartate 1-decarboxylase
MDYPLKKMLLAKIHGARVTDANLDYEGSITIPADMLQACSLLPGEAVCVWNVTTGSRFETYILEGEANSCEYHVNGAAAHLVTPGDTIIIASFGYLPLEQARTHTPTVVFLTSQNQIREARKESPQTIANIA